jgi:hypothetical protein
MGEIEEKQSDHDAATEILTHMTAFPGVDLEHSSQTTPDLDLTAGKTWAQVAAAAAVSNPPPQPDFGHVHIEG